MNLNLLFNNLIGTWDFNRTITSPRSDAICGQVKGKVVLSQIEKYKLLYQENGVFTTLKGSQIKTHQQYIYQYCPENKVIEKYFSEQGRPIRLFYRLNFEEKDCDGLFKAKGFHLCQKDKYHAEYIFYVAESLYRFILTYRVKGPQKNYTATTEFNLNPTYRTNDY